ncbi:MAG: hypothetical protein VKJ24_08440 [Synechococcales bacterium]|nr:hypothetical protein [Synechococcales bacterium]
MNLPFVLEVIISLVFIYLVLSLLASEVQELIATILQWRAKHLRDSIANLLGGTGATSEQAQVTALVNEIYDDPLIKNINQEAKGVVAKGFRKITQWLFADNRPGAYGTNQATGPSYIAADTFSTALTERLGVNQLVDKLVETRLQEFIQRLLGQVELVEGQIRPVNPSTPTGMWEIAQACCLDLTMPPYAEEVSHLVSACAQAEQAYRAGQATLLITIDRISENLDFFIQTFAQSGEPAANDFYRQFSVYKQGLFGLENERAIVSGGLQPSLNEVSALFNRSSNVYKTLKNRYEGLSTQAATIAQQVSDRVEELLESKRGLNLATMGEAGSTESDRAECLEQALSELSEADFQIYDDYQKYLQVQGVIDRLPTSVRDSLEILARRAKTRVQTVESSVDQFRQEIGTWFDRSMSRTSGVYKRNAKGVAIIIGVIIAMITNSDTFHILSRLSSDQSLRQVIAEGASQVAPKGERPGEIRQELESLKNQTEEVLTDIPLPITWNPSNLSRQLGCPYDPSTDQGPGPDKPYSVLTRQQWNNLYKQCLQRDPAPEMAVPLQVLQLINERPFSFLRMLTGWFISGIAIAMGAPFWFDLLGRVVNVRNAGSKPKSSDSSSNP